MILEFEGGPKDGEERTDIDAFFTREVIVMGLNPEYVGQCALADAPPLAQAPSKYLEGVYRIYCTTLDRSYCTWEGYR